MVDLEKDFQALGVHPGAGSPRRQWLFTVYDVRGLASLRSVLQVREVVRQASEEALDLLYWTVQGVLASDRETGYRCHGSRRGKNSDRNLRTKDVRNLYLKSE